MIRIKSMKYLGRLISLIFLIWLFCPQGILAAETKNFESIYQDQLKGEIKITGNSLQKFTGVYNPNKESNNDYVMNPLNEDTDPAIETSSSGANLYIEPDATVEKAFLVWGASINRGKHPSNVPVIPSTEISNTSPPTIKFKTPNAGYQIISPTEWNQFHSLKHDYSAYADVTELVKNGGAGMYWAGDIPQSSYNKDTYGGWSLIVVFADETKPMNDLSVFFGHEILGRTKTKDVKVEGITTPKTGPIRAKVGMIVWEGDKGRKGDYFALMDPVETRLFDDASPVNNFFNSGISDNGYFLSNRKPANTNNMGIDAKVINIDGKIENDVHSITYRFGTVGDWYYPTVLTNEVELYTPNIKVEKTAKNLSGNDPAKEGDILEYTINLKNIGFDAAKNTVLKDPIPDNLEYVPDTIEVVQGQEAGTRTDDKDGDNAEYDDTEHAIIMRVGNDPVNTGEITGGNLAYEETYQLKFQAKIKPKAIGGDIINDVELTYDGATSSQNLGSSGKVSTPTEPAAPKLKLEKTGIKENLESWTVGDKITYTFTVTNTGNVTLKDLQIQDEKVTSYTPALPDTLAPGEQVTVTAVHTVTQEDIDDIYVKNTAKVIAKAPRGDNVTATDSHSLGTIQTPDFTIEKTADKDEIEIDDEITYNFKITNTGNVTLKDLKLEDPMFGNVPLNPTILAPGEDATASATYTVLPKDLDRGFILNTATVTAVPPDGVPMPKSAQLTIPGDQSPSFTFEKSTTDSDGKFEVGDEITYVFKVINTGNVTLKDVMVKDSMFLDGSVNFGDIAKDGFVIEEGHHTATQEDMDRGFILNTATVSTEFKGIKIEQSDSVRLNAIQTPDFTFDKTTTDKDMKFDVDDEITYVFTIKNTGNVTLKDPTIDDSMFQTLSFSKTELAPGEEDTVTATYIATQEDVDRGIIQNNATVTATPLLGEPIVKDGTISVLSERNASFDFTKSSDKPSDYQLVLGETITYYFTIENTGNTTLRELEVVDSLPGLSEITWDKDILPPGEQATGTATYIIRQKDMDEGKVTNMATATAIAPEGSADPEPKTSGLTIPVTQTGGISLVKTADKDADAKLKKGETVTYSFTVTNTGNITVTDISIEDPLEGLSPIIWTDEKLIPGDSRIVTATYQVTGDDVKRGKIENTATVTGKTIKGEKVSGTDTVVLNTVKSDDDGGINWPPVHFTPGQYPVEENPEIKLNREQHYAYMFGYPDGSFQPDRPITRAEVAVLFTRLSVETGDPGISESMYFDVPQDVWYADAVHYLGHKGIIKGYPDGSFQPGQSITRAEFAAIASRYEMHRGTSVKVFPDVPADHWALADIENAARAGWIHGYPDGSFQPEQSISRGEVVTIVNRMLNRQGDENFILAHLQDDHLRTFTDLEDRSHWAYIDIMEATNGHEYHREEDGKTEKWLELNQKDFYYNKWLKLIRNKG